MQQLSHRGAEAEVSHRQLDSFQGTSNLENKLSVLVEQSLHSLQCKCSFTNSTFCVSGSKLYRLFFLWTKTGINERKTEYRNSLKCISINFCQLNSCFVAFKGKGHTLT